MIKNFDDVRVRLKRDTETNWETNNPVLLNGELIFVDTANNGIRMKLGDGVTAYKNLSFLDDLLRTLISTTYATKEELAALNVGFVASESDM